MAQSCGLNIATAIYEKVYVVPETECGKLAYPNNTGEECILIIEPIDFNQQSELLPDKQLRPTRSRRLPMLGRVRAAEWGLSTYVKPSGTVGNPPQEGKLLKFALGKETISSTEVRYELESIPQSFSLWFYLGHTVYALSGCTVNQLEYSLSGESEATYKFSGNGMKLFRATISAGVNASTGDTEVNVKNPEYFTTEAPIYFVDEATKTEYGRNNPYIITDIIFDTTGTNHKLVLDRAIDFDSTAYTIMPQIPENCVDYGYPQFGKYGVSTLNGTPFIITEARVSLNNNIKYYENEKNSVPFATSFGVVKPREIDVEVTAYFRPELASFYYKHFALEEDELVIPAGDIPGRICEWRMPQVIWEAPSYRGNEEVEVQLKGQAITTTADGNDELVVIYK